MTLSTSVIDKRRIKKRCICFLCIAAGCLLFDRIYAIFSHGVSSNSMRFMFLYPLLLGVLGSCVISRSGLGFDMYCCGVATLTVGSLLRGIFEIAGTASGFQWVFLALGGALLLGGLLCFLVRRKS